MTLMSRCSWGSVGGASPQLPQTPDPQPAAPGDPWGLGGAARGKLGGSGRGRALPVISQESTMPLPGHLRAGGHRSPHLPL